MSTVFTEGLDHDMDLWALGFGATWVQGMDAAAITAKFSLDPSTRTPCRLSEILDRNIDDGSVWVAEVGDWLCVVPGTYAVTVGPRAASPPGTVPVLLAACRLRLPLKVGQE
ncbi:hypothetical protein [Streptosporangium jomthongense]|uniref:Uncharacterized protein n=1 Tax=Streptosporangium jomthongense TaxID=1193683 RepID=A0ABV8F638_9ACTN